MVCSAFINGSFDGKLGHTSICLVPKVEIPRTLRQYRPISLCNVAYKVITKVFVN